MRRRMRWRIYWSAAVTSLSMVAAVGCATLPPARPANDLKQIVGKWEGTGRTAQGNMFSVTTTIREDGSWESIVPSASNPGPRFVETTRVEDGKFRAKSETTGRLGTWTLHEGDGKRVLRTVNDDGSSTSEQRPAK